MTVIERTKNPARGAEDLAVLGDGLDVLIRFHDREIDGDLLAGLHRNGIAAGLRDLLGSAEVRAAVDDLVAALEHLGPAPAVSELDLLAAEFADLYLTHGYRVAPNGSVWLTEDKLERQLPMFEVRDWYDHYGVAVPNWRVRADDHLVHLLQFVSHLCHVGGPVAAQDAARFLDMHVLPWMPHFCRQAAERVRHPVYAAVMRLTDAYLDNLRTVLEAVTGSERSVRRLQNPSTRRTPDAAPFVPGAAESW